MSNVIQFRKLPEVSYGIEIDPEYESRYKISLRRYPDRADKIMILICCSEHEQLPALREVALQEARKGYPAICRGSNPYGWKINNIMSDMKKS